MKFNASFNTLLLVISSVLFFLGFLVSEAWLTHGTVWQWALAGLTVFSVAHWLK